MQPNSAILTFSHLRWDFVYQRPQHLLSRLSHYYRVIFIEEPLESPVDWQFCEPAENVLVCRPRNDSPELVRGLVEQLGLTDYVLWFYTPMALPLAEGLSPKAIVYDCMDELSAFLNAPAELKEREAALLQRADLVFTGGSSLYRAKRDRHPNVRCFPSSVDAKHFASAAEGMQEPADQADLPHPRLGFFGVIDERLDVALLDAMASAHPEWSICMVGPVVKIDPATLPRHPNIRYFGQRTYQQLPAYLAGWDVCLLPFARNASTRFISPTKTLEYMAAAKMIVSTPITDVAEQYGDIVYLGETPGEFIAACERALAADAGERASRRQGMCEVLGRTSWDSTVAAMHALLAEAVRPRRSRAQTIVIGAGPTGLSAAYHLGEDCILLERNASVGGWCRSVESKGFTFDFAGHIMFSNDPYVHQLYSMLLAENVHWQDREAWIYSKNVYTRYPFQGALYGLPPEVIKECIMGVIEAHHPAPQVACTSALSDCCADGIMEASAPMVHRNGQPRNFEEFIYQVWGRGIARHFAIPYNRKLWAVPLAEMETSWLGGRVPLPNLEEVIEGALSPVPKPMGPNARFGYPLRGGFQALMNAWLPHIRGEVRTGARVVRVSPRKHSVMLQNGEELRYKTLISTMPLPVLIRQIEDEAPAEIQAAAAALRHVSVRCVHLGIGRENLTEKHWIYYPEETIFHRIFVQGNASPHCNPPGGFGLTCEITYSPHKPLPVDGDALIQRCIEDCRNVGIIGADDPVWTAVQCDLPYAYVVYDHGRSAAVAKIREWLANHDILLAGRYSEWEYYNSDHAFLAGKKAADRARERASQKVLAGLVTAGTQLTLTGD
jgi:UDP-galactopyranose mutase